MAQWKATPPDAPRSRPVAPIRVVLVSDVRLYRDGIAQLLHGQDTVEVVASAQPGTATLLDFDALKPLVILLDAAVLRTADVVIGESISGVRVVALGVADQDEDTVLACAEAGAVGFVSKDASLGELLEILTSVSRGEVRCSPKVTSVVVRRVAELASTHPHTRRGSRLTPRETEVTSLVRNGLSNKEIAHRLQISISTVKHHVHSILAKLHLPRRRNVAIALPPSDSRTKIHVEDQERI